MKEIDLSICKRGDILVSKHGAILRYLEPLDPEKDYYDHRVEYLCVDGEINNNKFGSGTRNNDGSVFKTNKRPEDHDIIQIIPLATFKKLLK